MRRFQVQYVGDLDVPAPEAALEVADDCSYVRACRAVRTAMESGEAVDLWVHTSHHAAWLKEYLTQLRVDADFSEKTARIVLADRWAVTVPDWVTEDDILAQGLIGLDVKPGVSITFEAIVTTALLNVDVDAALPDARAIGELIAALTDEAYASVKSHFPILEEVIRRLAAGWRTKPGSGWPSDLCAYIPENVETLRRVISASTILGSYPEELLERVLPPGQAALARAIPSEITERVSLESGALEEAMTQIKLFFAEITPKIDSRDEFRKVVSWVSGKTPDEFGHIEAILKSGRIEPSEEDVRIVRGKFEGCVGLRRTRLDALKHIVRPMYPTIVRDDETRNRKEWIRWTVDQYVPYRDWQTRNRAYDAELEQAVCRFSDWYVDQHTDIQADTDLALIHALNSLNENVQEQRLTVILMIDCLPVTFFGSIDQTLRSSGFKRHDLSYRFAALPSVTEYNKAAIVSGMPGPREKPYRDLLTQRSARDWKGVAVHYVPTIQDLSELDPGADSSVVFFNHLEGDEILHSNVEAKNRTYDEELTRSYSPLSEALAEMCGRWPGPRDQVSVIVMTDHGACRVLEEEGRSFDSAVVSKLFNNEKHRVATMAGNQAQKVPKNLWDIGYRFTVPFSDDDSVHFLPRGHSTVRKAGPGHGYMHGGATPEEVIIPVARYGLLSVPWKRPFARFLNLEMSPDGQTARFYIQRVVRIEIEIQNPNSVVLQPTALELLSPDAAVKGVELRDVDPDAASVLSIDLYFQKAAQAESSLELVLRYTIGGEEYERALVLAAEFRSAMSGGFSLKDL